MSVIQWKHVNLLTLTVTYLLTVVTFLILSRDPGRDDVTPDPGNLRDYEPNPFLRKWRTETCRDCTLRRPEYVIRNDKLCRTLRQRPDVLFTLNSHPGHVVQRQAVRATWGRAARRASLRWVFVLGRSGESALDRLVTMEAAMFGDVVMGDFQDKYENLAIKTVLALHWATTYCPDAGVVFKTDDDMYINIPAILRGITDLPQDTISGNCFFSGYPHRSVTSKWYTPYRVYPHRYYDSFCLGSALIMTQRSALKLYLGTTVTPYFNVEDVYISALSAREGGVGRRSISGLKMTERLDLKCRRNSTVFATLLSKPQSFYHIQIKQ